MSVRPQIYTELITLKISITQRQTLDKMRGYNITDLNFNLSQLLTIFVTKPFC
jgi:hypothetical protein